MVVLRRKAKRPRSPDSDSSDSAESGAASTSPDDCSFNSEDSKTRPEEPFHLTVFRVCGALTVILILGSALVVLESSPSKKLNFRERQILDSAIPKKPEHVDVVMVEEEGLDELPSIDLNPEIAQHDAFGVAQQYLKTYTSHFMHQAQQLQSEYTSLYGGIRPSRHLLENTLMEFGGDAWVRLVNRKRKDTLHMAVLGDGTAAGYGNHHEQAFSFELEALLKNTMKVFDITFSVTNIALEHVAHFPYLWCIPEHFPPQDTIDVVYVDLGEITAPTLELALRQILQLGTPAPLLILRDTKQDTDRIELLQHYIEGGILQSPVLMEWKDAAVEPFLRVKPSLRPPGFLEWEKWGADDSPHVRTNKKSSYWSAAQHKMVAWVLAMFLLKQLELMVAHDEGFYEMAEETQVQLPSPILVKASSLKEPWSKYLYHSSSSRTCLSSFADNLHPTTGSSTQDVLLDHPKGMLFYTNGWVLDLESAERKEKLRSQHLGFKDMLASYYGVPASGTLTFDLQLTDTSDLIVCEAQGSGPPAQPPQEACKLDQDVEFTINKDVVKSVKRIKTDFVSFEGKHHCVILQLATRMNGKVVLSVQVTNEHVTLSKGPCSISHIIWQEDEESQTAGWDAAAR